MARLVRPIIAFMGVRISWDMRERKSDLARLVSSAFSSLTRMMRVFILKKLSSRITAAASTTNPMDTEITNSGFVYSNERNVTGATGVGRRFLETTPLVSSSVRFPIALLSTEYRGTFTGLGTAKDTCSFLEVSASIATFA